MEERPIERRLAAILTADVVGYSRLMGADEVGTLRALRACRRELIDPVIAARHGRIVKTTGDGMLVEFASAVDAVACAITVQQAAARRNQDIAEDKRLVFRVGINIGDVIVEHKDIFGDGVNVAARLESLCEPGGICISRAVRDQVRDKLPVSFDDLGEQVVKNIARPVRVFGLSPPAIGAVSELAPSGRAASGNRARLWMAAVLVLIAVGGGGGGWWLTRSPAPVSHPVEVSAASPVPVAPGARASIAVLPFASLSTEAGGDYFADGLTEDIIGALGRFRDLSVIAPSAVFAYKGKSPTPADVGRDLKVSYIVNGSIRRSPDRIRVSVNLTEAARSALLWSEKYDAELKDVFSVQDQITRRISGALAVRVTGLELQRSAAKPPSNLEAYDLVLRGRERLSRLTRPANAEARDMFERAIELDLRYAPAYVGLGNVNLRAVKQGWTQEPSETLERAETLARRAIALDDQSPGAHTLLGTVQNAFGDYDQSLDELKRAIDLNPSDAGSYENLVGVLLYSGDFQGAIAAGELLVQFEPEIPDDTAFDLSAAYLLAGKGSDAIRMLEHSVGRNGSLASTNIMLAAAYAEMGREEDAKRQSALVRQRFPTFSRDRFWSLLRDPKQREKLASALQKAGL